MVWRSICMVLLCVLISPGLSGQQGGFEVPQDTVADIDLETVPREKARLFSGRPGRAALYSLILPGAGQAYNKKYWQVPIVWAGVGAVGYIMLENSRQHNGYSEAYRKHIIATNTMEPVDIDPESEFYEPTAERTRNQRDRWNRYRQLSIVGFAAVWIANSAQAYVSGHLLEFDIDDDLSMQVIPMQQQQNELMLGLAGPSLILKF